MTHFFPDLYNKKMKTQKPNKVQLTAEPHCRLFQSNKRKAETLREDEVASAALRRNNKIIATNPVSVQI